MPYRMAHTVFQELFANIAFKVDIKIFTDFMASLIQSSSSDHPESQVDIMPN